MQPATLFSLALYFMLMLGIGVYAMRRSSNSNAGYLLGGRQLGPAVTALSAGASDMSAWILMGLPGAMVVSGVSSLWIVIGLLIGAWFNYRLLAPRLRTYTELANDALTLPDYFARRFADHTHLLRLCASVVIVVFFTLYTSSGLVAGGVLFESAFSLPYELGMAITLAVVVAYTLLGGFHAVCLTDFVQGCLMLIALVLVPGAAWWQLHNLAGVSRVLEASNAHYFQWFEGAGVLAVVSNLAWGLGYFGQPHIVVRFMAIQSVGALVSARRIGMAWMLVSVTGAALTGSIGFAWMLQQGLALNDPETIFIVLTQLLFHPLTGGILLAAILAAIMSTISSQLLVSSSSLSEDFYRVFLNQECTDARAVQVSRMAVVAVAIIAALLARNPDSSILGLVSHAWAGFGAAFGPLILFSLYWPAMNWQGALAGMLSGAAVVLFWIGVPLGSGGLILSSVVYEIIPGVIVSSAMIVLVTRLSGGASTGVREGFEHFTQVMQAGESRPH